MTTKKQKKKKGNHFLQVQITHTEGSLFFDIQKQTNKKKVHSLGRQFKGDTTWKANIQIEDEWGQQT